MINVLTGNVHKVNLFRLLDELSTIDESNLYEIELHLYALKGSSTDNEELVDYCNLLIETIDNVFNYMYIEEEENARGYIKEFKEIVAVMKSKWHLTEITL